MVLTPEFFVTKTVIGLDSNPFREDQCSKSEVTTKKRINPWQKILSLGNQLYFWKCWKITKSKHLSRYTLCTFVFLAFDVHNLWQRTPRIWRSLSLIKSWIQLRIIVNFVFLEHNIFQRTFFLLFWETGNKWFSHLFFVQIANFIHHSKKNLGQSCVPRKDEA